MNVLLHPNAPGKIGYFKWPAVICSLPSWVYIAALVSYRFWMDGKNWPHFAWLPVPGFICFVCSMVSMTIFLMLLDDSSSARSEIFWLIWAAFPICFAVFLGLMLWVSLTFGGASMYDYYGWN